MATPSILLRHLVWALLLVLAVSKGSGNVSKEEYSKMKSYLRFINRPAVKSIQTDYGDIFDCVDIYKQPALDHPSLQNHTIQVNCEDCAPHVTGFGLPDGGCPPRTVPIRRVQMEDLLRAGSVSKFLSKNTLSQTQRKHAFMRTYGNHDGMEVTLSLWNPQVPTADSFSLSQFWLRAHSGAQTSTMEAGWQVYPSRHGGSTQTRLFTFWTPDNYNSGCYDLACPGFVQVSSSISPGMVLNPVSTIDGTQYDIRLFVIKETTNNIWALIFGESNHLIGYWPISLFPDGFANIEEGTWGGEVASTGQTTSPPMGSGRFASEGQGKAAYVKNIKLYNAQGNAVDVPSNVEIGQCSGCYSLVDMGNAADGSGRKFFYGGPGGTTCTCLTTQVSDLLLQVA